MPAEAQTPLAGVHKGASSPSNQLTAAQGIHAATRIVRILSMFSLTIQNSPEELQPFIAPVLTASPKFLGRRRGRALTHPRKERVEEVPTVLSISRTKAGADIIEFVAQAHFIL